MFRSAQSTRYAGDHIAEALRRAGLDSVDRVFDASQSVHLRHTGRGVWSTQIDGLPGDCRRVYIKMNWGRMRLWPRSTDLKTGQWLQSLPEREWRGLHKIAALGINVPQRLALFREGRIWFRSAVIVRAVPPARSIFHMLQDGSWYALSASDRTAIFDEVAGVMRRIHAANLGWRGTSTGHFYPQKRDDGGWSMWIIDCEGVHSRATHKTIERDYRKLHRSLVQSDADEATRLLLHARIAAGEEERTPRAA